MVADRVLPGKVEALERAGRSDVIQRIDPLPVRMDFQRTGGVRFLEADDPAHLVSGLRGAVEDCAGLFIGRKRLSLDDSDGGKHPKRIGFSEMGTFAIDEFLEVVENTAVTHRQKVCRNTGRIRKDHRFCLSMERVDFHLLDMRHGGCEVLWIFVKPAQENEYVVGAGTINKVIGRNFTGIARRKNEEFSAFPGIGAGQADIACKLAAIDRDRTLPEIQQDALESGRGVQNHRSVPPKVQITHGVEHIGVGGGDESLRVEALFPDGQDMVARAEDLLRAVLHAERVDQRQRPEIGLGRPLKHQLIAE